MKKQISYYAIGIVILIIVMVITPILLSSNISKNYAFTKNQDIIDTINTSDEESNSDIIDKMIDNYIAEYDSNEYFPSSYEPSLQGIYFSLSILDSLDKLNSINQTEITQVIMSYYEANASIFIDEYAKRYLDTDFEMKYYPLSTLLEVNCYAVLSLEILGQLELINTQSLIDFIWNCYNSSSGGFIGQKTDTSIHKYFKISTLDNTYYAVKALDILLENWQEYNTQKTQIINFIQNLQVLDPSYAFCGAFFNDANEDFDSITPDGPNMLSSYYAVKTLELFGVEDSLDIDAFHNFLDASYNKNGDYFEYIYLNRYPNFSIFASTAMGLDLSLVMDYEAINITEAITFILNNRNELGIWDCTTYFEFYELIDTFQILRSLSESNNINKLNAEDKEKIADAMGIFESYQGYSFTTKEYMKINIMFSIIQSCALYDRISELELHELYLFFKQAYYDSQVNNWKGFFGYTNINGDYALYRLYPIEFYNEGIHNNSNYLDYHNNHKFTYQALTSLKKIFKLDDFKNAYNLSDLIESIERCQITEETSDYFGAFLPFEIWKLTSLETQEKFIIFEQTYFAIKTLAYLTEYLGIGNLSDTNIDLDASYVYITKNIEETAEILYYDPEYIDNPESILKNTYYLIDLLHILDQYSLPNQKIKNLILQTINYSNIESVYYSYKIDEALNLEIQFNLDHTHNLIQDIYDDAEEKLYLTPEHTMNNYEILYWISYMAIEDEYRCNLEYDTIVKLNGNNHINATICNIILEGLGPYGILKLESQQLGTHTFYKKEEGYYEYIASIPLDPANYPMIYANVCLYEASQKIKEYPISFSTEYIFGSSFSVSNSTNNRDIIVSAYLITAIGNKSLCEGTAYVDIYRNEELIQRKFLAMQNFADHTEFTETINCEFFGEYRFEIYVNDGLEESDHHIGTYSFSYTDPTNPYHPRFPFIPSANSDLKEGNFLFFANNTILFPIIISLIALPIGIIAYTTYRKKKHS
jgi:prenyltransferase beta subunit